MLRPPSWFHNDLGSRNGADGIQTREDSLSTTLNVIILNATKNTIFGYCVPNDHRVDNPLKRETPLRASSITCYAPLFTNIIITIKEHNITSIYQQTNELPQQLIGARHWTLHLEAAQFATAVATARSVLQP